MVASPKLSRWFYQYEALNRPLDAPRPPPPTTAPPTPPTPARPRQQQRGFPTGRPRKRLTEQQRSTIIDLLKTNPHSPSTVAKKFTEAAGVSVSTVTVFTIKRKAIKLGKLSL
jgi:hypothetical protein